MPSSIPCSGCGKEHIFQAVNSILLVCRHCRQLILKDKPATAGQKVAAPREDMSVICIGTTGKDEKGTFKVVGRVQHFYQEGYRNLWYLLYQNGDSGWLGDWEGGYSLLTHHKAKHDFGLLNCKPGKQTEVLGSRFELRRIGKHQFTTFEGELPQLLLQRESFMALELGNKQEQVALIHAYSSKEAEAFAGCFEHFKDFSFNHLRPHHEWV